MGSFKVHTETEQADMLARKLPNGYALLSKYIEGSILRKWLISLGYEFARLEGYMNYVCEELSLISTQFMIDEFEFDYGMNSNCFSTQDKGNLEQRIQNILTLIASEGTSTAEQFENVASLLGFEVTVSCCLSGSEGFPYTFPITFLEDRDERFKIYVTFPDDDSDAFPYTFPIEFKDPLQNILKCFFAKLKPANCIIVYI